MRAHRPSSTLPPQVERLVEPIPYFTYRECGKILGCNPDNCRQAEQRAFRKIAANPIIQQLFRELIGD